MTIKQVKAVPLLEALVFDMDGTLFDSATAVPDAYIEAVKSLGGSQLSRHDVIAAYPIGPPAVILAYLLERPLEQEDVAAYHKCLSARAQGIHVYPDIARVLAGLAKRVALAVFTGADLRACSLLLRAVGLDRYFAATVGGDEVFRPKPAPDGVLLACERLGTRPGPTVAYVGDSPRDLEAAKRAKTLAIAAGWGHEFSANSSTPLADMVLRHPAELLALSYRRNPEAMDGSSGDSDERSTRS